MLSVRGAVWIVLLVGCADDPSRATQRGSSTDDRRDAGDAAAPSLDARVPNDGLDAAIGPAPDAQSGAPDAGQRDAGWTLEPDASLAPEPDASLPPPSDEPDGGRDDERDAGRNSDAGSEHDACALRRGEDAGPYATFTEVYTLLRQRCPGCHDVGVYGLNLSSQRRAYDDLIGGPEKGAAQYVACANQGHFYVVPCDPDASLLMHKFGATQPCGGKMPPPGNPQLSFAQVDLVRSWIAGGALDD